MNEDIQPEGRVLLARPLWSLLAYILVGVIVGVGGYNPTILRTPSTAGLGRL
jgi:hypothetical protein